MPINWKTETVFCSGGTGTFGNALADYLLPLGVKKLRIFSRGEERQRAMATKFAEYAQPGGSLTFGIGDVRELDRLRMALRGVTTVFHAAALKQIGVCEYSPFEAVSTNVIGTENVLKAALECGVRRVLVISSDKAVSPLNLYGATKMCAERVTIAANAYAGGMNPRPVFAVARYGNVAGSTGSVVHVFREQMKQDGWVRVTDPAMTRFWWTAEDAVKFAVDVAGMMEPGGLYVPQLPSVRIKDIALEFCSESLIQYTGIRTGEKLHETMISADEMVRAVPLQGGWLIRPDGREYGVRVSYNSRDNDTWLTGKQAIEMS
jgi:UDP-N-acetylglucosamine 4,6-dehydratase